MQPAVSVKDLKIAYGDHTVIDKMSIDIAPREFLVLLGPSGCGKSTLLNSIAGLQDISDGEIWISDKNVTWAEPKDRGIGMVFQSYALYPRMSVRKETSPSVCASQAFPRPRSRRALPAPHRSCISINCSTAGPRNSPAASASASRSAGPWCAR